MRELCVLWSVEMAVNMAGVTCRGMRCVGDWKSVQRCRDGNL